MWRRDVVRDWIGWKVEESEEKGEEGRLEREKKNELSGRRSEKQIGNI